jgi:hypothetical protein
MGSGKPISIKEEKKEQGAGQTRSFFMSTRAQERYAQALKEQKEEK